LSEEPQTRSQTHGPLALFVSGAVVAAVIALVQLAPAGAPHLGVAQVSSNVPGLGWLRSEREVQATDSTAPESSGPPVVHNLHELSEQYGEPADANYGRLRIPSIQVDAPLGKRAVQGGQLPDPSGPSDVVWYEFARNSGLGGTPGAGGNAILAGHVDRNGPVDYAGVHYNGPGVFFLLDSVGEGDVVELAVGGKVLRYMVIWTREVAVDDDWHTLFSSRVQGDTITLVTCAGKFDHDLDTYSSRLVVRAVRG
jgi:LPXTG-site transpeptidase (sortase) family protein